MQPLQEVPAEFPAALRPLLGVWHHTKTVGGKFCATEMMLQPDFTWERVSMNCMGLHRLQGDARPAMQPANECAAAASATSSSASAAPVPYPCLVLHKMFVISPDPSHDGGQCRWAAPTPSAQTRAQLNLPPSQRTTADVASMFKGSDKKIRSAVAALGARPGTACTWL